MYEVIGWNKGNRKDKAGLTIVGNVEPIVSYDYACYRVPLLAVTDTSGNLAEGGEDGFSANTRLTLKSSVHVAPAKYWRVMVDVNPELHKFGIVGAPRIIESEEPSELDVHFTVKRKFDPESLDYLLRLYLLA